MSDGSDNKVWRPIYKGMSKEALKTSFRNNLQYALAKDEYTATDHDNFMAMAIAIRNRIVERWIATQQKYHKENVKRVYYLSMEFLIGRLLGNNILNLGLWRETKSALKELGLDLDEIRGQEQDAGLGNGGLGRLAACFLDSMATLGIPGQGYGIRYDYGIFRQKIVNGYQVESPDEWLKLGNPWEIARPEYSVTVKFYGKVAMFNDEGGRLRVEWKETEDVLAMPYDIPVSGYKNDVVNTLRLWSAKSTEEFDFKDFNKGDYEGAVYSKVYSESISKVLYPSDISTQGKELRLKQEYFFTAAAISDIIRRFKVHNKDFKDFPNKVAIQLNDTHPAIAIVEFMRILIDEEFLIWDKAWDITVNTFAYTNHTIMPEALESWPVSLLENMLPRHMQIIYEINSRFLKEVADKFGGDSERLCRMSIIDESKPRRVKMAFLSIVGSHSVNGVSKLHSRLIATQLFRDFYDFCPQKFNNKTNGITQRRWLNKANMKLARLITEAIGDKWLIDSSQLKKLLLFKNDKSFREKWQRIKLDNKKSLATYIYNTQGISVDPNSLFDVQVKRIHEYKRQMLFALYIISQYLELKDNPTSKCVPRTFLVGGKAAPGYFMAKLIIKFINSVARVVNNDKDIRGKLKIVFLDNYRVSLAEKVFPASDLSEQISTAGMEASGTGCMKFMLNGALTIGTLDGANIEIAEAVGKENIFTFGLDADGIQQLRVKGYKPGDYIRKLPVLRKIVSLIKENFFSSKEPGIFDSIIRNLTEGDPFFICADFQSYCETQRQVGEAFLNREKWLDKAIINVAEAGRFSSDRTIVEYARDIWDIDVRRSE
ncbi:MAG: glycogen/starch/alpha-glucan phosphorylase [Candidatus Omnitrophota bacterium]|nr:glycogen/starch/alpha-glucan phosphorylase [Candidatus Omnitrophota bacterium]